MLHGDIQARTVVVVAGTEGKIMLPADGLHTAKPVQYFVQTQRAHRPNGTGRIAFPLCADPFG